MRLRHALTFGLILSLAGGAVPSQAVPGRGRIPCRDHADKAKRFTLTVDGQKTGGHYSVPTKVPKLLVVFSHGYQNTTYSWVEHMKNAADHGFAAAAMDYRGAPIIPDDEDEDRLPRSRGWQAKTGAEDSVAVTQLFDRLCPTIEKIVIMGVSMGGNVSGLAVAEAGRRELTKWDHAKDAPGTDPLYDYWIDVEGATNITETYLEARTLAQTGSEYAAEAVEVIEQEMGGPIESNPDAYRERTVVARSQDIAAAELDGVVIVHAVNDGLVPYNQAREMTATLRLLRVPTEFFTVTTRDADSERETTLTGYVTDNVDDSHTSPLVGHAWEGSKTHIVMNVSFDQLWQIADGAEVADSEVVVYGTPDSKEPNYIPGS